MSEGLPPPSWTFLRDRIDAPGFPLVLAGPLLRKVTADSVTVWLALRWSATVTLELRTTNSLSDPALSLNVPAVATSTKLGPRLHVVVVTAHPSTSLLPNQLYFYNLRFHVPPGRELSFGAAICFPNEAENDAVSRKLSYAPYDFPTFSLPPTDIQSLRLIHASCRKPHAQTPDALPIVDKLIEDSLAPQLRPHLLLFTGDQIYADTVAAVLALMVQEAALLLMGEELLPNDGGSVDPRHYPPTTRKALVAGAGLTTEQSVGSHLLSLGEYLAMYLFVWSDTLWPRNVDATGTPLPDLHGIPQYAIPDYDDVRAAWLGHGPIQGSHFASADAVLSTNRSDILTDRTHVQSFAAALPAARRVLANVPVYMIFDDHEVTEDWNLYRSWCEPVYNSPLGVRIIQNALCAYAICQHWGNTPQQFAAYDPPRVDIAPFDPAGLQLLHLLNDPSTHYGGLPAASHDTIRSIVGIHILSELTHDMASTGGSFRHFHDPGRRATSGHGLAAETVDGKSLIYHYSIEAPAFQIIVTDSRTWRSYPRFSNWGAPDLIQQDQLAIQIPPLGQLNPTIPPLGNRALVLVMTTNVITLPIYRQLLRDLPDLTGDEHRNEDLADQWDILRIDFGLLLAAISRRFPGQAGSATILSGDVHCSSAARLQYWAESQVGDLPAAPTPARLDLCHFVSSALHNDNADTRAMHSAGYSYSRDLETDAVMQHVEMREQFVGWNPVQWLHIPALPQQPPVGIPPNLPPVADVGSLRVTPPAVATMGAQPVDTSFSLPIELSPDWPIQTLRLERLPHLVLHGIPQYTFQIVEAITQRPHFRFQLDYVRATRRTYEIGPVNVYGTQPLADRIALQERYRRYVRGKAGRECVGFSNVCEVRFDSAATRQMVRWFVVPDDNPGVPDGIVTETFSVARDQPQSPTFRYPGEPPSP